MNYNYNVQIQYNVVEQELIEKINLGEKDYSKENVEEICNELYKIDLLKVFKLEKYEEVQISNLINKQWVMHKNNKQLIEILDCIKQKIFSLNKEISYDCVFIYLLSYDFLPLGHILLQQLQEKNDQTINEIKNRIIEKINLL